MNPRVLLMLALFVVLISARRGHAQFGVYGEFNGAIDGSSYQDPTSMYGATVGGYFNLLRLGQIGRASCRERV